MTRRRLSGSPGLCGSSPQLAWRTASPGLRLAGRTGQARDDVRPMRNAAAPPNRKQACVRGTMSRSPWASAMMLHGREPAALGIGFECDEGALCA